MMKALIYVRTSSNKQASSILTQTELCKSYCEKNQISIGDIYVDKAKSGWLPISKRASLSKLLNNISEGDILMCTYEDRLFRDYRIGEDIKSLLKDKGCELIFIQQLTREYIDLVNKLYLKIYEAIYEFSQQLNN